MSRSATDATRFTSTTPYASAKPPSFSSNQPRNTQLPNKNRPTGETPQQKVKRLRAAADAARNSNISLTDKIISRGRVWADRAHYATALSLIGLTVIAGGVTVYALGDMMIHNRSKRAQFFEQKKAQEQAAVYDARSAVEAGTATARQIEFLTMWDAEDARLATLKAQKKTIGTRIKEWAFWGLKKEEDGDNVGSSGGQLGYESLGENKDVMGDRESEITRALEDKKINIAEKAKDVFAKEKERQRIGGPLDRLGTSSEKEASGDEPPKSGGWTSFMIRR